MTKPDLAALSDAATQGSWHVAAYYHNSGTPDERCGGFIEADDSPTGVIDENWAPDGESLSYDLDFIVALVNAYRSGDLVLIDREVLRERAINGIRDTDDPGAELAAQYARLAITTLDRHRIERAGEVAETLEAWGEQDIAYGNVARGQCLTEAAALIASLRAENERARQEGWNAAIEAAAAHLERDDGYGEWWEAAATIRALASDGDNI